MGSFFNEAFQWFALTFGMYFAYSQGRMHEIERHFDEIEESKEEAI